MTDDERIKEIRERQRQRLETIRRDHAPEVLSFNKESAAADVEYLLSRIEGGAESLPWNTGALADWSIVGMNHYHVEGERRLFVAMTKDGQCITNEGSDEALVFHVLGLVAATAIRAAKDSGQNI